MATSKKLADMRGNFVDMKEDLTASMKLCRRQFDTSNRLMFTITELLYNAIENVQLRKPFKASSLLYASFQVIEKCENEKTHTPQDEVTLKFARSFTLFMDSLDGYCMSSRQREYYNIPRPQPNQVVQSADTTPLSASKRLRPAPASQIDKTAPPSKKPCSRPAVPLAEPGTAGDREIKLEEPDYEDSSQTSQTFDQQLAMFTKNEVKEEEDLIKEEPFEQPISDTVSFEDAPSTSVGSFLSRHMAYIPRQKFSIRYSKASHIQTEACPFCQIGMQTSYLDHHIRTYHKGKWLEFVRKCPEVNCDFRSHSADEIHSHKLAVHNVIYEAWKDTKRFELPPETKCPYCPVQVRSLSQFINHMDSYHQRLTTYEVPILKCGSCRFTAARCFQMFVHWRERAPSCCKGLRFLYNTAQSVLKADHEYLAKDILNSKIKKRPL